MVDRRRLVAVATAQLDEAGVPSPEHDAAALLAHVLGTTRAHLVTVRDVSTSRSREYAALVDRRSAREPLQHLTGRAGFRTVELLVGPGVFVPRPETELLAGWAIEQARESGPEPTVVDLCTGSGAIALSVATEVPAAAVHAVELDPTAHSWAQRNLMGSGVNLQLGDMATALQDLVGSVDVVVCNPPYIPLREWGGVAPEARDHDPALALWSGDDGLDALRVLERRAAELLRPGGWVGTEHADVQGGSVQHLFGSTGRWHAVRDHVDLAGRPRFLTARLAR